MENLNLNKKYMKNMKNMTTRKKKVNISWKYKQTKNTNLKLYKSKEGKTMTTFYTFCVKLSGEQKKKKEKKNKKYKEVFSF